MGCSQRRLETPLEKGEDLAFQFGGRRVGDHGSVEAERRDRTRPVGFVRSLARGNGPLGEEHEAVED